MKKSSATTEWVKIEGLAAWFGCSESTMRRKLPDLYSMGFPQPNAVVGKWYLPTCQEWAGSSGDLACDLNEYDPLMSAIDGYHTH